MTITNREYCTPNEYAFDVNLSYDEALHSILHLVSYGTLCHHDNFFSNDTSYEQVYKCCHGLLKFGLEFT